MVSNCRNEIRLQVLACSTAFDVMSLKRFLEVYNGGNARKCEKPYHTRKARHVVMGQGTQAMLAEHLQQMLKASVYSKPGVMIS